VPAHQCRCRERARLRATGKTLERIGMLMVLGCILAIVWFGLVT
jgi:hypothetical protein